MTGVWTMVCVYIAHCNVNIDHIGHVETLGPAIYLSLQQSSTRHGVTVRLPLTPPPRRPLVTCHASRVTWLVTQLLNHLHGRVSTLFVAETGRCELWQYSLLAGRTRSCSPIPGQPGAGRSPAGDTVSRCCEMADSGCWMEDIYIGK